MEADLRDLTNSVESLRKNYLELEELCHVLQFTNPYFEHVSLIFTACFSVISGVCGMMQAMISCSDILSLGYLWKCCILLLLTVIVIVHVSAVFTGWTVCGLLAERKSMSLINLRTFVFALDIGLLTEWSGFCLTKTSGIDICFTEHMAYAQKQLC